MKNNSNQAVLIIDMINDFQFNYGPILAKQAEDISHNISSLKKRAKSRGCPIIYINDHYQLWQADFSKIAEKCKNQLSEKIIHKLFPEDDDFFLIKPKHSAFYGTALNTLLYSLHIKDLIITGIAGNICVLFTANDAYMREYNLTIPPDCIASNTIEDNNFALKMMENTLKASISKSSNIKIN
ncbi:nicotinamidase-related amidase [Metabacillus crassostreae]|uniref:isochorismatase family cysteine hydrolase n=1 Tax=Metabacillus crassostreae TaxID=929098 RepID=UPI00195F0CED|nr:isochorismatase family cysteine hydrolase [Metabacillus crassostreae]MBM7606749.1 nicotinamidase-related amidase [Metabacillus crassostreae]